MVNTWAAVQVEHTSVASLEVHILAVIQVVEPFLASQVASLQVVDLEQVASSQVVDLEQVVPSQASQLVDLVVVLG